MRSIIYKNYKRDDNEFNFKELKIKKIILAIGFIYALAYPAYDIYKVIRLVQLDFGNTGIEGVKIEIINFNLHLLSLQITENNF